MRANSRWDVGNTDCSVNDRSRGGGERRHRQIDRGVTLRPSAARTEHRQRRGSCRRRAANRARGELAIIAVI